MIDLDDVRRILKKPDLSDEDAGQIRDDLYAFAHALIDDYIREKRAKCSGSDHFLSRSPQA